MWDFVSLNTCEDEKLFGSGPTQYTYGQHGTTVLVEQRRLPDEIRPEDTGSEVWPASEVLARYLERESLRAAYCRAASLFEDGSSKLRFKDVQKACDSVQGLNVIELGAGMGLVGLAARALGAAKVVLTDIEEALPGLQRNVELNPNLNKGSELEVCPLDWRSATKSSGAIRAEFAILTNRWKHARSWRNQHFNSMNFDLILCSDCVVWPHLSGPLCATLNNLIYDTNVALLSVVHRCKEADDFPAALRCHFSVEELWSSPVQGDQPEGHIKIYRAARRARPSLWSSEPRPERTAADLVACVEAARETREAEKAWTCRSLEQIIGARAHSVMDFKASTLGCWPGPHALSCRLALVPSAEARKGWNGKRALRAHLAEVASLPPSVFVKRVIPAELVDRDTQEWAQCAHGYLTELRFFENFSEVLRCRGAPVPRCYCVRQDGTEELEEALRKLEQYASDNAERGFKDRVRLWRSVIFVEDLATPSWEQELFLSEPRTRAALGALARLHGTSMGDSELLARARQELRRHGGYWAATSRDPSELAKFKQHWASFVFQFAVMDDEFFSQPEVMALATRLCEVQAEVEEVLRGPKAAQHRSLALLHGDLRTNHLYFSTGCESNVEVQKMRSSARRTAMHSGVTEAELPGGEAAVVGFRWCGVGFGVQDVAHLLLVSAEYALLEDGAALGWLITSAYLEPLGRLVGTELAPAPGEFFHMFRLACFDYAKVALGYHLVGYDPHRVRTGKSIRRPTHNRSISHTMGLIRFLDRLLDGEALEALPGFGKPSAQSRVFPSVAITGAAGPDAHLINGIYELQGRFLGLEGEPPIFHKASLDGEADIWLYLAENGTWCVSDAGNMAKRACVCWAHSGPQGPASMPLPSAASDWQVTAEDDWEPQPLRVVARLLGRS